MTAVKSVIAGKQNQSIAVQIQPPQFFSDFTYPKVQSGGCRKIPLQHFLPVMIELGKIDLPWMAFFHRTTGKCAVTVQSQILLRMIMNPGRVGCSKINAQIKRFVFPLPLPQEPDCILGNQFGNIPWFTDPFPFPYHGGIIIVTAS